MPTTHRTNDYTTPSLALTNGSTFGDLLLLSPGCPHLPEIQNTCIDYLRIIFVHININMFTDIITLIIIIIIICYYHIIYTFVVIY